jgi:ribosome maturation factor RimP
VTDVAGSERRGPGKSGSSPGPAEAPRRSARTAEIEALIAPVITALDCALWGVELNISGRHRLLRIYIDREEGVAIEDCEAVSRRVSAVLDVEDPLKGEYTLEVSSPGMDRILFRLEHYAESVGETADVRLVRPFDGRRRLTGTIAGVEDDEVVLQVEGDEYLLPLEWIQRARIVPRFD